MQLACDVAHAPHTVKGRTQLSGTGIASEVRRSDIGAAQDHGADAMEQTVQIGKSGSQGGVHMIGTFQKMGLSLFVQGQSPSVRVVHRKGQTRAHHQQRNAQRPAV